MKQIGRDYPFDRGVVDASPAAFELQMACVKRFFTAITADELRVVRRNGALPKNPIVISFDDGYRDNLHVVVPILQRYGLRATFFIATSYITERRLFWWDRISYLVHEARRDRLSLRYPHELEVDCADKDLAIRILLKIVKRTDRLELDRFLDEVTAATGVAWDRDRERAMADELLMTWDEVRELRARGMDVQSHTSTHRVLNRLDSEDVERDLLEARLTLERELGAPVRALSYPCGFSIEGEEQLCAAVQSAGYELGFRYGNQIASVADGIDRPLHLNRVSPDYEMPMSWFRGMLAVPSLTY